MWLVTTIGIAGLLGALHVIAMALASTRLGARPARVQIFYGPSLVLRRGAPEVRLGMLPLGGYIVHGPAPIPREPAGPYREAEPRPDATQPTTFALLSPGLQALVLLSGNVALLALAVALAGPGALVSAARLPLQFVWLLLDNDRAVASLRTFAERDLSLALVGTIAAKLAAANLLPLPGVDGSALLALVLRPLLPARLRGQEIGALIPFTVLALAIGIALVVALVRM